MGDEVVFAVSELSCCGDYLSASTTCCAPHPSAFRHIQRRGATPGGGLLWLYPSMIASMGPSRLQRTLNRKPIDLTKSRWVVIRKEKYG